MIFSGYSKRKLEAWAIIDGKKVPAVSIQTEFSLNAIPTATVSLPVGYDGETSEDSFVERENNLFTFRKKISLWVSYKVEKQEAKEDGQEWIKSGLESTTRIFLGYIAGIGYERTVAGLALTVSVEHWLSDLAASSALSGSAHSTTPGDMQRSALLKRSATNGSSNAPTAWKWINNILAGENVNDLWEEGYKKVYEALCESDALIGLDTDANAAMRKNSSGLSALKKMYSTKAPLKIIPYQDIKKNIVEGIRQTSIDSLSGQTLWDNLIAASATFMFAISPHVEDAEVFPFCPSVKHDTPYRVIRKSDITNISFSGDCPRAIRAVCLMHGTGIRVLPAPGASQFRTIGKYINEKNTSDEGTIIYRSCPSWIQNSSDQTIAVTDIPSVSSPNSKTSKNLIIDHKEVRNMYAKTIYGFEILRGRQGTLTGPLRQDIGVGSYIMIEIPESLHTGNSGIYMKGIVLRVSSNMIAQSAQSSTTLTVGYLRMESESNIEMESHPLYSTMWSGSSNLKMSP